MWRGTKKLAAVMTVIAVLAMTAGLCGCATTGATGKTTTWQDEVKEYYSRMGITLAAVDMGLKSARSMELISEEDYTKCADIQRKAEDAYTALGTALRIAMEASDAAQADGAEAACRVAMDKLNLLVPQVVKVIEDIRKE